VALAEVFGRLRVRGVKALLSNSMTPRVVALYGRFHREEVWATRAVNSRADRRSP
jgi:site-specific DNA-adenine methylase